MLAWRAHLETIKKPIPKTQPYATRKYQRRITWHPVEIPQRVAEARARYPIRHLGDLLVVLGIPYRTAHTWAVGRPARTVKTWSYAEGADGPNKTKYYSTITRPALKPHSAWLTACGPGTDHPRGVPIPAKHELHFLRYVTNPIIDAVQERLAAIETEHAHDHEVRGEALHDAIDEIVGATYMRAIEHRSARRKAKFGFDPIQLALDWSVLTRGAPKRTVVEAVTKAVVPDWDELNLRRQMKHALMTPVERKDVFVPPTERRPGSRRLSRKMAWSLAKQRFAQRRKETTVRALMATLGYVPKLSPAEEKRRESQRRRAQRTVRDAGDVVPVAAKDEALPFTPDTITIRDDGAPIGSGT